VRKGWQTSFGLVVLVVVVADWASPSGADIDPASSGNAPPDQQANALQKVEASPKPANRLDDAQAAHRVGDYATALRVSRELAEQGDAAAQAMLGLMYAEGQGVAKDDAEAVKWYREAAEQGSADGQGHLGFMYQQGRGLAKDDAEAVKWYRKAADQGFARAQAHLGFMYAEGRGVAKDDAEAVKWYRKAADQGDSRAQADLGFMYAEGRGVSKDDAEAVKWYRKAAEQGLAALSRQHTAQEGENQIYRVGGDVHAPKLLNRVEPAYPQAARQARIDGVVILEAVISASGDVTDIAVLKSVHPLIDAAAVRAVRQWRYSPATRSGSPVSVYLTVTTTFNLGLPPPKPRPPDSLVGNWQVPGQRIWIWIGQDNRAYQCRITSADVVSRASGVVDQTSEGRIIRWQSDWSSDSVRRYGDELLLTNSEGIRKLRPLDGTMAPSCTQK
jgi:TonB family protein